MHVHESTSQLPIAAELGCCKGGHDGATRHRILPNVVVRSHAAELCDIQVAAALVKHCHLQLCAGKGGSGARCSCVKFNAVAASALKSKDTPASQNEKEV